MSQFEIARQALQRTMEAGAGTTGKLEIRAPKPDVTLKNLDGALPKPESTLKSLDGALPKIKESNLASLDGALPKGEIINNNLNSENPNEILRSSDSGKIYKNNGVHMENPINEPLQGTEYKVYLQKEIDPNLVCPDGRSNLERMHNGEAPYVDIKGTLEKVELHHHGQRNHELVELPSKTHRENDETLHPHRGAGEGRGYDPLWDAKRNEHWINRAETLTSEKGLS